ncbi:PBP1A family penicillin-binding protein [Sporosarcina sp. Marseille-Q4063]|uniref:penicillin-binding protein 1A n=1 Tax=Sporosarcina sp. Marseille-Q4063 TaxID=2810514 RepID=UPI001BAF29EC|nr:penicillin-binding protein 1A [Sporosarcina sp. Marseille-Q4063]QUW22141.1 PBP1A family penicillin-binding protein [Sporosarcina sp. Marseille-Q4063]
MSDKLNSRVERRKAQENARNKKPKNTKGVIKKVFLTLVILGFAILIGGAGLFLFYASSSPKLDEELLRDPVSSEFLDKNDEVFHTTGSEKREYVNYDEIPKLMEDAILATEDVRFYSHHGMDFKRLGGAVLANFRSGFGSQGASTLTQQVIKNSFLSADKTLKRKSQEAWLAFQLEREYDKEEIFEMYFNKILMSGSTYGFGTAAEHFYGKKLAELDLHEVAMLAGLPQSPNGYNPFINPERAEKRRNIVLGLMYQHGKITKEQMEDARTIDVASTLQQEENKVASSGTKYPAFIDLVLNELEDAGVDLSEGLQIHTTLDPAAQRSVEDALASAYYANEKVEAGLTVLDTKTGEIVAVGSRNYKLANWSYATQEKRQLGSTIKPLLSYGPAIEYLNWSTGNTVVDAQKNYKDGTPIRNVDRKFLGTMTAREALYRSRNIPAVTTYDEVGHGKANEFAAKLGIAIKGEDQSNALGGTSEDFSTAQLAGAYAAFGNGGVYTKPHAVKKIVFRDGKTEKQLSPDSEVVMKDSTAYMVTDMLRDVLKPGIGATGANANVPGLDIAGKTGTTNNAVDSWFAGYSTNYTIAAWSGYKDRTPMESRMPGERLVPQELFKTIMTSISAGKETARFQKPSSVEEVKIVYGSNPLMRASSSTPSSMTRTELFVKGTVPKEIAEEIKLDAPTKLKADFDEKKETISLKWNHKAPKSKTLKGDVEFIVYASMDGGEKKEMMRTTDNKVTFTGIEGGKTYTFEVVAILGELQSEPASISIRVEEAEEPEIEEPEEPVEPEEPIEEEPEEPIEEPEPEEPVEPEVPGEPENPEEPEEPEPGSEGTNNSGNNGNNGNRSNKGNDGE